MGNTVQGIQIRAIGVGADLCFFAGKKYSGKSYLAKHLLSNISRFVIWDYNFEHSSIGTVTHDLKQLIGLWNSGQKKLVYQPYDRSDESFTLFVRTVKDMSNLVVMIEEVRRYATSKKIIPELQFLIDTGRHRGIGLWFTSRRMHGIAVDIPFNADHIFAFKQHRPEDLDYLAEFMNPELVQELPTLPNYWFIHYVSDEGKTYKHMPI